MADGGMPPVSPGGHRPKPADGRDPNGASAADDFGALDTALAFVTSDLGSSLVRPYAVTGGRTKPRYQLQIEAMVAASHYEARDLSVLSPECQSILGFC